MRNWFSELPEAIMIIVIGITVVLVTVLSATMTETRPKHGLPPSSVCGYVDAGIMHCIGDHVLYECVIGRDAVECAPLRNP